VPDSRFPDLPVLLVDGEESVLLDISMPHITGDVLLERIRETYPQIPVIIITASEDIDVAVRRAVEMRELTRRYSTLRERLMADEISRPEVFARILTQNRRMEAIFVFVESIAPTAEPVLIMGGTGTGKELVAEAIHLASGRPGENVTVNVASLDDTMFADTLFGHLKGTFTGAQTARSGLVQQARGGTRFLDEIGDLPLPSQIKLLRLLEKREYFPLGSDLVSSTDARFVVAATA